LGGEVEVIGDDTIEHRDDSDGKARWITLAARMLPASVVVVAAGTAALFVATYILSLL
jgi:hypothetical protein